jgi:hypothetical protein
VEDQLTRAGLVAEVDTSLPGGRVVRILDGLVAEHAKPAMIVSDSRRNPGQLRLPALWPNHGRSKGQKNERR